MTTPPNKRTNQPDPTITRFRGQPVPPGPRPPTRTLRTSTALLVLALIATVMIAYTLVDRANTRANTAEAITNITAAACER